MEVWRGCDPEKWPPTPTEILAFAIFEHNLGNE
jgi:hypothetical protein